MEKTDTGTITKKVRIRRLPKVVRDSWELTEKSIDVTVVQEDIAGVMVFTIHGLDFDLWFPADVSLAEMQDYQIEYLILVKLFEAYPQGKTTLIKLKGKDEEV